MVKHEFSDVPPGVRRIMQAIRSRDTKPELRVRRYLHAAGLRFRLHRRDLPGTPDLTFPALRTVVEVRGCFWHGHGCGIGKLPQARREYWEPKIAATRRRDRENRKALEALGWRVIEIWECDLLLDADGALATLLANLRASPAGDYAG